MPRSDTWARERSIIYTKLRHALRTMTGLRCHRSADRDWLYLLIVLFFRHSVSTESCDILRYSCLTIHVDTFVERFFDSPLGSPRSWNVVASDRQRHRLLSLSACHLARRSNRFFFFFFFSLQNSRSNVFVIFSQSLMNYLLILPIIFLFYVRLIDSIRNLSRIAMYMKGSIFQRIIKKSKNYIWVIVSRTRAISWELYGSF